ncbi:MAG: hypothetical protein N3H31_02595 [Candidatus Nezhaarchaeota archaeon]|nr:hypothetical protein [Candidatus Nezhaarchaeota archaeon]
MEERVRLGLAILIEAEAEGEDEELVRLIEKVARKIGGSEELIAELSDLLGLPPRVALCRLMRRKEWEEALRKASEKYLEQKLKVLEQLVGQP